MLLAAFVFACRTEKPPAAAQTGDAPPAARDTLDPNTEPGVRDALTRAQIELTTLQRGAELDRRPSFVLTVDGSTAVAAWRRARQTLPDVGYWPVLMEPGGEPRDLCRWGADGTPEQFIELGRELSVKDWFAKRPAEDPESFSVELGDWPSAPAPIPFTIPFDVLTGSPKPTWLVLFPTSKPWEVPALCRYGGTNLSPPPPVHVALHEYWHDAFGAELVGMTDDRIEMTVARPPATRDAARALAREQFLYCPDIVIQGVGDLEPLAASLMNSRVWYFWWD